MHPLSPFVITTAIHAFKSAELLDKTVFVRMWSNLPTMVKEEKRIAGGDQSALLMPRTTRPPLH